jgi:hypothetical protein
VESAANPSLIDRFSGLEQDTHGAGHFEENRSISKLYFDSLSPLLQLPPANPAGGNRPPLN